ncbi:MAG: bifunctional hydroxymethylpyrimidine kinase/phosphomethylpyrimidine kinase [Nannocystaceae bacterium]
MRRRERDLCESGAPVIWLLGGLDPSGGAGILRDHWTARALLPAARVGAIVSAWTWQGQGAPARSEARPLARIVAELRALPRPDAVKVGLVPQTLLAAGLGDALVAAARGAPLVVDPVLVASDGGDLGAGVGALRGLAAAATVMTPNLPEARALLGIPAGSATQPSRGALLDGLAAIAGATAWLLKGGHVEAESGGEQAGEVADHLRLGGRVVDFRRPRRPGPDPRGTGCALATAIACGLASGRPLEAAVAEAITWLDGARTAWRPGRDRRPHLPVAGVV